MTSTIPILPSNTHAPAGPPRDTCGTPKGRGFLSLSCFTRVTTTAASNTSTEAPHAPNLPAFIRVYLCESVVPFSSPPSRPLRAFAPSRLPRLPHDETNPAFIPPSALLRASASPWFILPIVRIRGQDPNYQNEPTIRVHPHSSAVPPLHHASSNYLPLPSAPNPVRSIQYLRQFGLHVARFRTGVVLLQAPWRPALAARHGQTCGRERDCEPPGRATVFLITE